MKYALLHSFWGNGYASKAVPKRLNDGASKHQLDVSIVTVAQENLASQRVLVKAGMEYSHPLSDASGSQIQLYEWRC